MTKDEVIHLAQQTAHDFGYQWCTSFPELHDFAERVIAAECEACAKIADEQAADEPFGHAKFRCVNIAAKIRERKPK